MPRVPYKNPAKGTSVIADAIRERRGTRGLTPLDQTLLNAPDIAVSTRTSTNVRTWLMFGGRTAGTRSWERCGPRTACRTTCGSSWCVWGGGRRPRRVADRSRSLRSSELRPGTRPRSSGCVSNYRETICGRRAYDKVVVDHAHVGVDAGLTAAQLTIIRDLHTPLPTPAAPAPLSAFQAAALRFADASTFSVNVPQSRVDDLKVYLKDDQQLLEATAVVATYNMVSRLLVTLDVGDMGALEVPLPETVQEEHDVEVDAGVTLKVLVAKRNDSAPWLVFVNSLMTNQKMWGEVLPRLSKKYNLITYDQRGHGRVSS